MNRRIGLLAMIVPVWFAGTYLTLSALRPEYSHLTKAISELGSVDAPRAWIWNLLGYILPGIGFLRTGNAPGLGQRFGFACFFLWVALVGYALYGDPAASDRARPN